VREPDVGHGDDERFQAYRFEDASRASTPPGNNDPNRQRHGIVGVGFFCRGRSPLDDLTGGNHCTRNQKQSVIQFTIAGQVLGARFDRMQAPSRLKSKQLTGQASMVSQRAGGVRALRNGTLRKQRARGMPGAQCTRSLVCA
jgi:hypothetical protein